MIRNTCLIFLLIISHISFCQDQGQVLTKPNQFSLFSVMQLSSTKWNACLFAQVNHNSHIFYVGIKTPVSADYLYGYSPLGLISGYGYSLIKNGKWEMATVLDAQWLSSKSQNQIMPTHYFDFTLNYQLIYRLGKKVRLNSSLGYGTFLKYFYRRDTGNWGYTDGVEGLVSVGIGYVL